MHTFNPSHHASKTSLVMYYYHETSLISPGGEARRGVARGFRLPDMVTLLGYLPLLQLLTATAAGRRLLNARDRLACMLPRASGSKAA